MATHFPAVLAASTTPVPVSVAPAHCHHRRRPAGVLEYDFRRLLSHDSDMTNGCAYSLDPGIFRRNVRNLDWLTRTLAGEEYEVRRTGIRDLHRSFGHLGRTLNFLRGVGGLDDEDRTNPNLAPYFRQVKHLMRIIYVLRRNDDDRLFTNALAYLARMPSLPGQTFITVRGLIRHGSDT